MTRSASTRHGRRCVATGEVKDKSDLIRFVVGPDGALVPDVVGNLPGRGVWLTASREALDRAVRKRLLARAVRRSVTVEPDLADRVEVLLARRCLEILGLARRAGQVTTGFEKVRSLLRAGRAGALVAASDGGADGREKLRRLGGDLPVVELLTRAELSLALGRENVVHAALAGGRLCDRFLVEAGRLAGFRRVGGPASPDELVRV